MYFTTYYAKLRPLTSYACVLVYYVEILEIPRPRELVVTRALIKPHTILENERENEKRRKRPETKFIFSFCHKVEIQYMHVYSLYSINVKLCLINKVFCYDDQSKYFADVYILTIAHALTIQVVQNDLKFYKY